MSLNFKNEETCRLIHELAELTGESTTAAVTGAVRERLERVKAGLSERLMAIGRDCVRHLPASILRAEHGDLLYGDDGIPRSSSLPPF